MKKQKIIFIVLLAVNLILTIISYIVLPETVITQVGTSSPTTMNKLYAVLIPAAIGIGGSIYGLAGNTEDKNAIAKKLILAGIGPVIFVIMLVVNLI